jgi:endonuclease III
MPSLMLYETPEGVSNYKKTPEPSQTPELSEPVAGLFRKVSQDENVLNETTRGDEDDDEDVLNETTRGDEDDDEDKNEEEDRRKSIASTIEIPSSDDSSSDDDSSDDDPKYDDEDKNEKEDTRNDSSSDDDSSDADAEEEEVQDTFLLHRNLRNTPARLASNKKRYERQKKLADMLSPSLYKVAADKKSKKSKKAVQPTSAEIELWKNKAVTAMATNTNANDVLTCYMIMGGHRCNPWQSEMSMYFIVAFVLNSNPYELVLGRESTNQNTLSLISLAKGNHRQGTWSLPTIPNVEQHLSICIQQVHGEIKTRWNTTALRLEQKVTYEGCKTVAIPSCPNYDSFKECVLKGRRCLWKIWWGNKDCCKRDVRKEVIEWATSNLMNLKTMKEFNTVIDAYFDEGLEHHKAEWLDFQSTQPLGHPEVFDPKLDPNLEKPKPVKKTRKKRKQASKNDDATQAKKAKSTATPVTKAAAKEATAAAKEATAKEATAAAKEATAAAKEATAAVAAKEATAKEATATKAVGKETIEATKAKEATASKETAKKATGKTSSNAKKPTTNSASVSSNKAIPSNKQMQHQKMLAEIQHLEAQIDASDPGLKIMVDEFKRYMSHEVSSDGLGGVTKYVACLMGCTRGSPREVWLTYHKGSSETEFNLEPPTRAKPKTQSYEEPSKEFVMLAKDIMRVMSITLTEAEGRGLIIIRSFWEYHLMKGINQLTMEQIDQQKRLRALLACLILSAASTDFSAIDAAIQLGQAGLLDSVDALADASHAEIVACIKGAGIHKNRSVFLKNTFKAIRDKHNGLVPSNFQDLTALEGVGRKTATLLLNEGFGFFAGIGTDKHVCHVSFALGLFNTSFGLKGLPANHVENSLRCWVRQPYFKETNKIFGGMAQLLTQMLTTINTDEQLENLNTLIQSIWERFHSKYELELLWQIIAQIRRHYKSVVAKREISVQLGNEESDDEAGEEEME